MNIDDLLKKLSGVKESVKDKGKEWMAKCPAHEDSSASLAVGLNGDKILLHCHAGCEKSKIFTALGLKKGDLQGSAPAAKREVVATYNYTDESGKLLYQSVRYNPKGFNQRRPDGNGGWIYDLKGITPVPYRLPMLLDAVKEGETIIIAEGEKDCDKLIESGFFATCNSGGAGKWKDHHAQWLRGAARITVLADKDEPGRKHAIEVARTVIPICEDVHVFELPNLNGSVIKDAFDFLTHGGTPERLRDIEAKLPPFNPDNPFPMESVLENVWKPSSLMAFDPTHDANAVIGLHDGKTTRFLCKGYGAWLIASSGIGKSSLAIQQAILWVLGRPFFGTFPVRKLRILFVQSENDEGDMAEPVQGVLESIEITPQEVQEVDERLKIIRCRGLTGQAFCKWLEKQITLHEADIAYVDPLLRFAGVDVTRTDQATHLVNDEIDPILARTGVVLIGIHHTGKPKQDKNPAKGMTIYDYMYAGIGSSELVNWARAVTVILPIAEGMFEVKLAKRGKRAWATHPDGSPTTSIFLKHHDQRIFWVQIDPPPTEPERTTRPKDGRPSKVDQIAFSNLHEFCAQCKQEGEGLNEIASRLEKWLAKEKIDMSPSTCKRAIPALVANGKLTKTDLSLYVRGPNA